ncbi:MAG: hypothetical protein LBM23_07030 [Propionibacteriaceae bacterium]|jgi:hypothetical protein|nr:hypothetical protein [Propionibacteriaceae bacterium]
MTTSYAVASYPVAELLSDNIDLSEGDGFNATRVRRVRLPDRAGSDTRPPDGILKEFKPRFREGYNRDDASPCDWDAVAHLIGVTSEWQGGPLDALWQACAWPIAFALDQQGHRIGVVQRWSPASGSWGEETTAWSNGIDLSTPRMSLPHASDYYTPTTKLLRLGAIGAILGQLHEHRIIVNDLKLGNTLLATPSDRTTDVAHAAYLIDTDSFVCDNRAGFHNRPRVAPLRAQPETAACDRELFAHLFFESMGERAGAGPGLMPWQSLAAVAEDDLLLLTRVYNGDHEMTAAELAGMTEDWLSLAPRRSMGFRADDDPSDPVVITRTPPAPPPHPRTTTSTPPAQRGSSTPSAPAAQGLDSHADTGRPAPWSAPVSPSGEAFSSRDSRGSGFAPSEPTMFETSPLATAPSADSIPADATPSGRDATGFAPVPFQPDPYSPSTSRPGPASAPSVPATGETASRSRPSHAVEDTVWGEISAFDFSEENSSGDFGGLDLTENGFDPGAAQPHGGSQSVPQAGWGMFEPPPAPPMTSNDAYGLGQTYDGPIDPAPTRSPEPTPAPEPVSAAPVTFTSSFAAEPAPVAAPDHVARPWAAPSSDPSSGGSSPASSPSIGPSDFVADRPAPRPAPTPPPAPAPARLPEPTPVPTPAPSPSLLSQPSVPHPTAPNSSSASIIYTASATPWQSNADAIWQAELTASGSVIDHEQIAAWEDEIETLRQENQVLATDYRELHGALHYALSGGNRGESLQEIVGRLTELQDVVRREPAPPGQPPSALSQAVAQLTAEAGSRADDAALAQVSDDFGAADSFLSYVIGAAGTILLVILVALGLQEWFGTGGETPWYWWAVVIALALVTAVFSLLLRRRVRRVARTLRGLRGDGADSGEGRQS